ncbi:MAG TPA: hemolysin family protein [Jiangellaceae bacterium]|nr:hemolysin family protein [Jiangellaceae bacterium]
MTAALGLLAVLLLTLGTGYFVAQEFAYLAADRVELSRQAAAGDHRAATAIRVMERLSFMLSAAQVGITVTGLVVGYIAEPAVSALIRPLLEVLGVPDAAIPGIAVALGFAAATVLQMVLGELAPKNFALAKAETLAKVLAPSTLVYLAVSRPVVELFDNSAAWMLRKVGIEPVEELHHGATLEELGQVIGESGGSSEHGTLSRDLSDLLMRALSFSARTAAEVMVPRPDVVIAPAGATAADLTGLVARHGHSHYPVVGQHTDDVLGVAGVRELMTVPPNAETPIGSICRPALMVPETMALPALVTLMQGRGEEFACVIDEYGGFAGVVTLEDIAEEVVGDIADENDPAEPGAVPQEGWWEVDAALRMDEVARSTGLALPDTDDYETVAGLIIAELGRFAEPGDRLVVRSGQDDGTGRRVEIEVLSVARRVPERVRVRSADDPVARHASRPADGGVEGAEHS